MSEQNQPLPEKLKPAAEKSENVSADQKREIIEKEAEAESRREEQLIDELAQLRAKVAAPAASTASASRQAALDADIEARKKKIVDSFVKAALASNFDAGKVAHIMHIAEKYIKKDYPDIADEIHDRIINEINLKSGGID